MCVCDTGFPRKNGYLQMLTQTVVLNSSHTYTVQHSIIVSSSASFGACVLYTNSLHLHENREVPNPSFFNVTEDFLTDFHHIDGEFILTNAMS